MFATPFYAVALNYPKEAASMEEYFAKLDALPVTQTPSDNSSTTWTYKNISVTIPDIATEREARHTLLRYSNCLKGISAYLKIPFPHENLLITFTLITGNAENSDPAHALGNHIFYNALPSRFTSPFTLKEVPLKGQCPDPHEVTHTFVAKTPIDPLLNEGLAVYMESQKRSAATKQPYKKDTDWVQCDKSGFKLGPVSQETTPYVTIAHETVPQDFRLGQLDYINTASCVWDYIDKKLGHKKFVKVIKKLKSFDSSFSCSEGTSLSLWSENTLSMVIEPVIGEKKAELITKRFGLKVGETQCAAGL